MIWAILLLLLGAYALWGVVNAFRPMRNQWLALPSLIASWNTAELTVHLTAVQMALAAWFGSVGALDGVIGRIGLGLLIVAWIGNGILFYESLRSSRVVAEELGRLGIARHPARVPRVYLVFPFLWRRRGVERIKNVPFRRVAGRVLRLDIYRGKGGGSGLPVLLYLHGGAWTTGSKLEQGLPILNHFAANGWLAVTANYRLSPGATFPDHLCDAKAALAWVREHISEYGGDPSFAAVSGGSAGGHLAAMVALTANDPRYQPGFEHVDTAVQAAVPVYGIYDFTNRLGVQYDGFVKVLLEQIVMKDFIADARQRFTDASPIDQVGPGRPPFLVAQGDRDNLAPVEEARAFVAALRDSSAAPVAYMEFRGAHHGFDLAWTIRSARLVEGALSFVEGVRNEG